MTYDLNDSPIARMKRGNPAPTTPRKEPMPKKDKKQRTLTITVTGYDDSFEVNLTTEFDPPLDLEKDDDSKFARIAVAIIERIAKG